MQTLLTALKMKQKSSELAQRHGHLMPGSVDLLVKQ